MLTLFPNCVRSLAGSGSGHRPSVLVELVEADFHSDDWHAGSLAVDGGGRFSGCASSRWMARFRAVGD